MNLIPLFYDAAAVALIWFTVARAYRLGFLRQAVVIVGYILALIGALYLSQVLARWCCDHFFRTFLLEKVSVFIRENAAIGGETAAAAMESLFASVPAFLLSVFSFCFGGEAQLLQLIQDGTNGIAAELPAALTDFVLMPVLFFALRVIFCLMLFILFVIIVKTIAKIFEHFYAIPILGAVNSVMGGLLGLAQAAIDLYLIGMLLAFLITLTGNTLEWFNDGVLTSTWLLRYFYQGATGQI